MKVAAFIPARYGSTRLPGKPLAEIDGRPMIQWVYERVARARTISEVMVATDDERILETVRGFGGQAVMTSRACRTGTERVAEAVSVSGVAAEIVVNVQGDEPLIEPALIDDTVAPLINDPSLRLATAKTPITDLSEFKNPNVVKVVTDKEGMALYFSRSPIPYGACDYGNDGLSEVSAEGSTESQAETPAFKPDYPAFKHPVFKHIGLYVYRTGTLMELASMEPTLLESTESLEQLRALENNIPIKVIETTYDPRSVDTPEDLERVRALARAND